MNNKTTVLTVTPNPAIDLMVTVDKWEMGVVNQGQDCYQKIGGKGVQVARVLAEVDENHQEKITATGWIGTENLTVFQHYFDKLNITDGFVHVDGATRTNVKITDKSCNDTTDINFSGLNISETKQTEFAEKLKELLNADDLCVLAGSLPHGVPVDFYTKLIAQLRQEGHKVILDTSGKALKNVIDSKIFPHIMKPNIHELAEINDKEFANEQEIIDFAKPWFKQGLQILVVSMGAEGALFISENEVIKVVPPTVKVISTVGAGDAMVAGICYGLLQSLPFVEIAKLATAVSASNISEEKRTVKMPTLVEKLLPQVKVTTI